MIIYLDVLFLKEIFFNSVIIFLTGKIVNQKLKLARILLASLLGTMYSIIVILMKCNLYNNVFLNFICAIFMNLIAFKRENISSLLKNVLTFYLITFVIGGLNLYTNDSGINIFISILLILILVPFLIKQYKAKFKLDSYYGEIILNNEKEKLAVFVDTGNTLTTCYDEPVIILSNKYCLDKKANINKIRRVAFRTINEKEVFVDGVKVEKVTIQYHGEKYISEAVLIESNVSFNDYDAIVGLDFFDRALKIHEKDKENVNGHFVVNKS